MKQEHTKMSNCFTVGKSMDSLSTCRIERVELGGHLVKFDLNTRLLAVPRSEHITTTNASIVRINRTHNYNKR